MSAAVQGPTGMQEGRGLGQKPSLYLLPPSPTCLFQAQGKHCIVSGSGNVAQFAALKLLEYGAVVLTMSDSTGYVYEPNGFSKEQIEQVGH